MRIRNYLRIVAQSACVVFLVCQIGSLWAQTPAAEIAEIVPIVHPLEGGSTMRILGSRFPANPQVRIGGKPAELFSYSSTTIVVRTPDQSAGLHDVSVSGGGATGVLRDAARFESMLLPSVESLECARLRNGLLRVSWANPTHYDRVDVVSDGSVIASFSGDTTVATVDKGDDVIVGVVAYRGELASHLAICFDVPAVCPTQFVALESTEPGPVPVVLRGEGVDFARVQFSVSTPSPLGLKIRVFSAQVGQGELKARIRSSTSPDQVLVDDIAIGPTGLFVDPSWRSGGVGTAMDDGLDYFLDFYVEGGSDEEPSFHLFRQDLPLQAVSSSQMIWHQSNTSSLPFRPEVEEPPDVNVAPMSLLATVENVAERKEIVLGSAKVSLLHPNSFSGGLGTRFGVQIEATLLDVSGETPRIALGRSYSWSFGDGEFATSASPSVSHVFPSAGTYLVRLSVSDFLCDTHELEFYVSEQHFIDPPPTGAPRISNVTPSRHGTPVFSIPREFLGLANGPEIPVRCLVTPRQGSTIDRVTWRLRASGTNGQVIRSATASKVDPEGAGPGAYWQCDVRFDGEYPTDIALLDIEALDSDGRTTTERIAFTVCPTPRLFAVPNLFEKLKVDWDDGAQEYVVRTRFNTQFTKLVHNRLILNVPVLGDQDLTSEILATVDGVFRLRDKRWYPEAFTARLDAKLFGFSVGSETILLPMDSELLGDLSSPCDLFTVAVPEGEVAIPSFTFDVQDAIKTRVFGKNFSLRVWGELVGEADWGLVSSNFFNTTTGSMGFRAHVRTEGRTNRLKWKKFSGLFRAALRITGSFDASASYRLNIEDEGLASTHESCIQANMHLWGGVCSPWCEDVGGTLVDLASPTDCEIDDGGGSGLVAEDSLPVLSNPSVASSPSGDVTIAVWEQNTADGSGFEPDLFWSLVERDQTLRATPFSPDQYTRREPQIAFLSDDQAILVWAQSTLEREEIREFNRGRLTPEIANLGVASYEIYFSMWNRRGGWSVPTAITEDSFPDGSPRVSANSTGATVIWERAETRSFYNARIEAQGETKNIVAVSINSKGLVGPMVELSQKGRGATESDPCVAMPPSGASAQVVWIRDTDGDVASAADRILMSSRLVRGRWTAPVEVGAGQVTVPRQPHLVLEDSSNGVLTFVQPFVSFDGVDGEAFYDGVDGEAYEGVDGEAFDGVDGESFANDGHASGVYVMPLEGSIFRVPRPVFHAPQQGRQVPRPATGRWPHACLMPDGSYAVVWREFGGAGPAGALGQVAAATVEIGTDFPAVSFARVLSEGAFDLTEVVPVIGPGGNLISLSSQANDRGRAATLATASTLTGPDVELIGFWLSNPFAPPGSTVDAVIRVRNAGLSRITPSFVVPPQGGFPVPVDNLGLQLRALTPGEAEPTEVSATTAVFGGSVDTIREYRVPVVVPADSAVLSASLLFPGDVRLENNEASGKDIVFGVPAPRDLVCGDVSEGEQLSVALSWKNAAAYDSVGVFRNGLLIEVLRGVATGYVDDIDDVGHYTYAVRGKVRGEFSPFAETECALEVVEPPPPGGAFIRADANADGGVDISDGIGTLGFLFLGAVTPPCADAADANDDGGVDITDAIFTLNYLFLGGTAPPAPNQCGEDPTADETECVSYPVCEA